MSFLSCLGPQEVHTVTARSTRTISLDLPPEIVSTIRGLVDTRRYADAGVVVGEALRLLDERDWLAWMRAEVAKGSEEIERGETILYTPELMEQLVRGSEENARRGLLIDDAVIP